MMGALNVLNKPLTIRWYLFNPPITTYRFVVFCSLVLLLGILYSTVPCIHPILSLVCIFLFLLRASQYHYQL